MSNDDRNKVYKDKFFEIVPKNSVHSYKWHMTSYCNKFNVRVTEVLDQPEEHLERWENYLRFTYNKGDE